MSESSPAQPVAQKQLERHRNEGKCREKVSIDIHFTSAEEFCLREDKVYCSRKMNIDGRHHAIPMLKYMSSVMNIIDHYRTHMRFNGRATDRIDPLPNRTFDLSKGEDVMLLATYFPYSMSHLFLMNMELISERYFEGY